VASPAGALEHLKPPGLRRSPTAMRCRRARSVRSSRMCSPRCPSRGSGTSTSPARSTATSATRSATAARLADRDRAGIEPNTPEIARWRACRRRVRAGGAGRRADPARARIGSRVPGAKDSAPRSG